MGYEGETGVGRTEEVTTRHQGQLVPQPKVEALHDAGDVSTYGMRILRAKVKPPAAPGLIDIGHACNVHSQIGNRLGQSGADPLPGPG